NAAPTSTTDSSTSPQHSSAGDDSATEPDRSSYPRRQQPSNGPMTIHFREVSAMPDLDPVPSGTGTAADSAWSYSGRIDEGSRFTQIPTVEVEWACGSVDLAPAVTVAAEAAGALTAGRGIPPRAIPAADRPAASASAICLDDAGQDR
ncbi:hypothetical protein ACWDUL_20600, partial [Nocardia niigatensis]